MKENKIKRFDVCLMNPPFGQQGVSGVFGNELDMAFTYKCINLSNRVLSIMPEKIDSNLPNAKKCFNSNKLVSVELYPAKQTFGINTFTYQYIGIYDFDNNNNSNCFNIKCEDKNINKQIFTDNTSRHDFIELFTKGEQLIDFANKLKPLYNKLLDENNSMVDDCNNFIYEENKPKGGKYKKEKQIKLQRVKYYLSSGKYKYCFYKGSFNNSYNEIQKYTGDLSVFRGQICWLTNKQNVYNNMIYWMEYPLCDFWRKYYMNNQSAACYAYHIIPALNFDKEETEFKEYVKSLYEFSNEDIKTLKEFNVHNAGKL